MEILKGPWLYFEDRAGKAVCQPDILLNPPSLPLYIIECKLSYKEGAETKLLDFYRPILERLYDKPICCVQVCRNLRNYSEQTYSLQEILATDNPYMVVHHT